MQVKAWCESQASDGLKDTTISCGREAGSAKCWVQDPSSRKQEVKMHTPYWVSSVDARP